jgi:hypothetical protein
VSPVKYELGFYIPEDAILHSHRRENLKSLLFKAMLKVFFIKFIFRSFAVLPMKLVMHYTAVFTHPCTTPVSAKSFSR